MFIAKEGRLLGEKERKRAEEREQMEITRDKILSWLKHANPDENHNIACKVRNARAKTGQWFLESDDFTKFKHTPRSLLWLHGIAGCGKSILSSTIIEELRILQTRNNKAALGYWYFSANDRARMNLEDCVRALISQYLQAFPDKIPTAITQCWEAKKRGHETPKISDLITTLQTFMSDECYTYYVVLDALDESSRDTQGGLCSLLQTLLSIIQREHVDADISAHIKERLQNDADLNKWPEEPRLLILDCLLQKAEGM